MTCVIEALHDAEHVKYWSELAMFISQYVTRLHGMLLELTTTVSMHTQHAHT